MICFKPLAGAFRLQTSKTRLVPGSPAPTLQWDGESPPSPSSLKKTLTGNHASPQTLNRDLMLLSSFISSSVNSHPSSSKLASMRDLVTDLGMTLVPLCSRMYHVSSWALERFVSYGALGVELDITDLKSPLQQHLLRSLSVSLSNLLQSLVTRKRRVCGA